MKPAEINLEERAPELRNAVAAVQRLPPTQARTDAVELAAVLHHLQADDQTLLAGLLVPLLEAGEVDESWARDHCGDTPLTLARELGRVGGSGLPPGWNPGSATDPVRAFIPLSAITDDPVADARLVVAEVERLGGFAKNHIVLSAPTGDGYVSYVHTETVEMLTPARSATS